jgi:hypothetical protein
MDKDNTTLPAIGVFLLGIAGGILISRLIVMDPDKLRKFRERRRQWLKNIRNNNNQGFRDMWGEFTKDERRISQQIKNKIADKVTDLKELTGKVDENQYIKIVQDTIRDAQEKLTLPNDLTERLQRFWENKYKMFTKDFET